MALARGPSQSVEEPLLPRGAELVALGAPLVEEGLEGLAGGEAGAGFGAAGDFVEHGVALRGVGEDGGGVAGLKEAEVEFREVGGGMRVDADQDALAGFF